MKNYFSITYAMLMFIHVAIFTIYPIYYSHYNANQYTL